ncbi:cell division protein FtsA [Caldalkalibacillus salinus]|uniref:cell division protein FtsA n=1 Tax=Caldalkalibacillus salinus TaxID=2803787 RepID=UPI0019232D35|nr:cell division protein FtsA [Caldalkalibacillus salinus]
MSEEQTNNIFALDIGTRSVVGIILQQHGDRYSVVDYVFREHRERSMVDGQIHDVLAVAAVIQQVKEALEVNHGPLKKVAVAAAGRSLRTKRSEVAKEIAGRPLLTRSDIVAMELEAVQLSQQELAEELGDEEQTNYYCVGYSVIQYLLDGEQIGNLIDQRGKQAGVEVISTFLPRVVVDSLISALKRAGLELKALTLEPIAAINVLIPSTMRRLNIALVDIGAGTSDIAITSEGAITAYGMVPTAGDEITETISQDYLLDFSIAEEIKRQLFSSEQVEFNDVLGFEQLLPSKQVINTIQPAVQKLAQSISEEIMNLNGRTPQAVMLIGGGALTPTLDTWIAEIIGLPQNRVGIRGLQINQQVDFEVEVDQDFDGPESVTPIGIAIAAEQHPVKYLSVTVNQNTVRLFDLQRLTLGDAILAAGLNVKKLHGKPGNEINIVANGKELNVPGTHGFPPTVYCNGEEVDLDSPLHEGDDIEIIPGEDGIDATVTVEDIIVTPEPLEVFVNENSFSFPPKIIVNGQAVHKDRLLEDRDKVTVTLPTTVQELFEELDLDVNMFRSKIIHYLLNEEEKRLEFKQADIFLNGQIASLRSPVQSLDRIQIQETGPAVIRIKDIVPEGWDNPNQVRVVFNDHKVIMDETPYTAFKNGVATTLEEVLEDGDNIEFKEKKDTTLLFNDIFRYVDFDPQQADKSKRMIITVNGEVASFDTPIRDGDHLKIEWH